MLQLDPKTISEFETAGVEKLKVFFYAAGCSGNKVDMTSEFEVTDDLEKLESSYQFDIYVETKDKKNLENARITKVVKADHTGKEKIRYIYSSDDVEDRCWCGTSFAFEKKKPKINLEKLKNLKSNLNIWK